MTESELPRVSRLLEINTLHWLHDLGEETQGRPLRLEEVPAKEWERIREFGFDGVWLMGAWQRSLLGRQTALEARELFAEYAHALPDWGPDDVAGSPYSIGRYEPDEAIGDWESLQSVHHELNRLGIQLILDFVPNHTGPDFPWVSEHPEYYVQGEASQFSRNPEDFIKVKANGESLYLARGRDPNFPPWTDTLQLNWFNPSTRRASMEELERLAPFCDGFRCDMAMLILNEVFAKTWASFDVGPVPKNEFWTTVFRRFPDKVWIAEAYWGREKALADLRFSFVYDKRFYDLLANQEFSKLFEHVSACDFPPLRFLENHDEERARNVFGSSLLRACSILFEAVPGLKLYLHGQLTGKKIRLPVQLKRKQRETPDRDLEEFYRKLFQVFDHPCFRRGQRRNCSTERNYDDSWTSLFAVEFRYLHFWKLVVVNLDGSQAQGTVRFDLPDEADMHVWLDDQWNKKTYVRDAEDLRRNGLHVILQGHAAHVFSISTVAR